MIYRKRGEVVRWENGSVIRVHESGVAIEEGDFFECMPAGDAPREFTLPLPDASPFAGLPLERLLLLHGAATHECGTRVWSEETRRLHASLTAGALRVRVDQATFDAGELRRIANALARAEQEERDAPPRVRIAPNVAAALLPSLARHPLDGARVIQTAGGIDGRGDDVVEASGDWPNWYRPSYRVRPVRAPLDLRIECDATVVDEELPSAVALLAPPDGLTLRVLIDDRSRVYPATLRPRRILAASRARTWYPYGAGAFGSDLML